METTKKRAKKRRRFHHLNQSDRYKIEAHLNAGEDQESISKILKVDAGTISREMKRRKRKKDCYEAVAAEDKANVKRSNSKYQGMKIEKHSELRQQIIDGLMAKRSPDEIAGRMKKEKQKVRVRANAIYKWLYSPFGQPYCKYLCTKRYKKRKQTKSTKREMIPNRVSLRKRPKRGVHAEGDLFVSSKASGSQRSGAIIVVPRAKLILGRMIENKKPRVMTEAVNSMIKNVFIDDITMDNGMENRDHEHFDVPAYFCDPYSPWQKPDVEREIGLIRRWFIKGGTNLEDISDEELQQDLHILNHKWRKSLGYQSAYEVALKRGIIQKIPDTHIEAPIFTNNFEKVAFH